MFYFLLLQLFTKIKYQNQKAVFYFGTLCYLLTMYKYQTNIYSLLIPIDISYTLYLVLQDRGLLKTQSVITEIPKKIIKEVVVDKTLPYLIDEKPLKLEPIINKTKTRYQDEIEIDKNKIKYIPHKLDIKSPLQQTVRNLGI